MDRTFEGTGGKATVIKFPVSQTIMGSLNIIRNRPDNFQISTTRRENKIILGTIQALPFN